MGKSDRKETKTGFRRKGGMKEERGKGDEKLFSETSVGLGLGLGLGFKG